MCEYEDDDYCYECKGYGDDYYVDEDGELVCNCFDCPHSGYDDDDWDWKERWNGKIDW